MFRLASSRFDWAFSVNHSSIADWKGSEGTQCPLCSSLIRETLEQGGYEVTEAHDGRKGYMRIGSSRVIS